MTHEAARPLVVFRVDGGAQVGSGHVMRCIALAEELTRRGARAAFVCREVPGHLIGEIRSKGYAVTRLPPPGAACEGWLGVPWREDARETRESLEQLRPEWLVVDHYGIDAAWERAQRDAVRHICVIDDLANRPHECEVLLDQTYVRDAETRYEGLIPADCRRLLGPRFAILRARYAELRAQARRSHAGQRVLVFFGGTDATNETAKALRALSSPALSRLEVDVVVGANHPEPHKVAELARERPRTTLHRSLPTLADLMMTADLAVGAGGTTTWERLCLRLPSVVVTVAANQDPATATLAAEGLIEWVGRAGEVDELRLAAAIERALIAPANERSLVDGHGAGRVGLVLLPPSPDDLRLARATGDDAELFFEWRNDPLTRAMSFDEDRVSWESHARWFADKLAASDTEIFVASAAGVPVGQARLDYRGEEAVLSYGVDAIVHGKGFGAALVAAAVAAVRRVPARGFRASVKAKNVASVRIFERLGWSATTEGAIITFRLHPV